MCVSPQVSEMVRKLHQAAPPSFGVDLIRELVESFGRCPRWSGRQAFVFVCQVSGRAGRVAFHTPLSPRSRALLSALDESPGPSELGTLLGSPTAPLPSPQAPQSSTAKSSIHIAQLCGHVLDHDCDACQASVGQVRVASLWGLDRITFSSQVPETLVKKVVTPSEALASKRSCYPGLPVGLSTSCVPRLSLKMTAFPWTSLLCT